MCILGLSGEQCSRSLRFPHRTCTSMNSFLALISPVQTLNNLLNDALFLSLTCRNISESFCVASFFSTVPNFILWLYPQLYPFTHNFECPWSLSHCFYEFLWLILWMPSIFISKLDEKAFELLLWVSVSSSLPSIDLCLHCGRSLSCSSDGQASWEFIAFPFISHLLIFTHISLIQVCFFNGIFLNDHWHLLEM